MITGPRPPRDYDDFANRFVLSEPFLRMDLVGDGIYSEPEYAVTTNGLSGSTFAATKEPGEPSDAGDPGGASVWWSWAPPRKGRLLIDPAGTSFSPLVAAYTGNSLSSLACVSSNNGAAEFPLSGGDTYALALDGKGGAYGDFSLLPLEDLLLAAPLSLRVQSDQGTNGVALQIAGTPGQSFALETSDDLVPWRDLQYGSVTGDATLFPRPTPAVGNSTPNQRCDRRPRLNP